MTAKHYTVINVERLREPMQKITDFVLKASGVKTGADVVPLRTRKSKTAPAR